jgi:hypothetical protein
MEIVHGRFLLNPLEEEPDCGALTGRLSCGRSETGQTNCRNTNLDGHALNGRSKTALHSAVVRLCHSRPAPFRCWFQNARSVRPSSSNVVRSAERDSSGFLKLESLDFFETPSPTKIGSEKRNQKPGN